MLEIKPLLSIIIFVLAYAFIATEKVNKTVVAIIGASLVIFLRLVSFEEAIAAVDFNVIFLLVGMMTCVHVLSKTGFFEWTAIKIAKSAKGDPLRIMLYLLTITAVLSAFLDNVTTIILLVPLTILIAGVLEISPIPFLILEAISSNIGGTSTLIGDPPNIIIGSQANLSFVDFLSNLGEGVLVIYLIFLGTTYLFFRKKYNIPDSVKARLNDAIPHLAITDRKNMVRSLIVMGLIFCGFFLHAYINIEPGMIALFGSMIMLLVCKAESEDALMKVEWGVIFFFIGMFMMISALEVNGVISVIGNGIIAVAGKNLFLLCIIVLWGSAFFSAFLDNIPFVITMVPLIKHLVHNVFGVDGASGTTAHLPGEVQALWWALALGACLGGNGTIIGASANIIMIRIAEKNKFKISFFKFFKYGMFFMIQSMIIATIFLWAKFFSPFAW